MREQTLLSLPVPARRVVIVVVILAYAAMAAPAALAQVAAAAVQAAKPAPVAEPPAEEAPQPIAAIPEQSIPARAESLRGHLRVFRGRLAAKGEVPRVADEFTAFEKVLLARASQLAEETQHELPLRVLEERADLWSRYAATLDEWSGPVRRRTEELLRIQSDLAAERTTWEETAKSVSSQEVLPALRDRIDASLRAIEAVEAPLKEQLHAVLHFQNLLATYTADVEEILAMLSASTNESMRKIVRVEMPPLWKLGGTPGEPTLALREMLSVRLEEAAEYAVEKRVVLLLHGTSLIVLLMILLVLRRRPIDPAATDSGLKIASHILARPFSATLAIGLLPLGVFYRHAPSLFIEICLFLTLFPFLRLLPGMIPAQLRRPLLALALLFVLFRVERTALGVSLFYRLVLLIASVAALIVIVLWRRSQAGVLATSGRLGRVRRGGSLASLILMSVAVAANVVGAVSLASLLANGTITALYMVAVLFAAGRALDAVLAAAGQSKAGRSLAFLRRHEGSVSLWRERLIHFSLLAIWIRATLATFRVWEPTKTATQAALEHQWTLGSLEFSLGGILTFCLVVVAAVLISRLTRFVVEEDVLPRMDLPRGVPGTISMLISYAIIGIGIIAAVSAAGLELGRVTLIAGALSLGIGFGLQGLVNNFVSGLILIFERPFSIGDTVEFGRVTGEVRSIGIRASVVRTFDGAEVIVPNGNLISGEVINWTLSDRQRRVELKVGVAYGTDPARVIELLVGAARKVTGVSEFPEPRALFTGFGESTLDFVVRAWTRGDAEWPEVSSALAVAVNRALGEAGVAIPFPQRDVHLRGGRDTRS